MGNLLGAPVTEKHTDVGSTADGVQFGVSSMQGWRVHMEDAHIAEGRLYASEPIKEEQKPQRGGGGGGGGGGDSNANDAAAGGTPTATKNNSKLPKTRKIDLPGHALFAVFDGHGGTYAAAYSGRNMCRVLSRQAKFIEYAKFTKERPEREKVLQKPAERTQYLRSGFELLESALCDTFVELDKEIAMALKGQKVPDADQPYHDDDGPTDGAVVVSGLEDCKSGEVDEESKNDPMQGVTRSNSDASPGDSALQLLEEEGDSGTTACVVMLTPEWIICANAGDSRAVVSRKSNVPVPLSYDHKPDDDDEERRIRAAGGYVAGGRVEGDLAVSRGLGDFRFKNIDVVMAASSRNNIHGPNSHNNQVNGEASQQQFRQQQQQGVMAPGDQKVSPIPDIILKNRTPDQDEFVIIACDGIWDVQTNYEAVKKVAELFKEGESNLGLICEEICDNCLTMGSKDNMTVLVIKFEAQAVGDGGGVLARRQLRNAENDSGRAEGAGGGGNGGGGGAGGETPFS